ncbi:uncharacterized protein LOC122363243 isoform X1 [Amphibalanus amphitrite]|uniref:uncharacterized protein LOC122363243 isoform X1 n=2 Tax=Amphibalanus amphitrite TaxID=1232801 RepID=UPI001C9181D9|nr:uncharacterized protein LOC122363243 isoform X1 [Amphibalanus amphitrite]
MKTRVAMWSADGAGGDSADWELSKENVQPLRQGRRLDVLNSSLQPAADDQVAQKVAEQRRSFELEIRTYTGDDPLSPWHRYVLWMEQHCPRGGHEGNLDGLLTQCIARFTAEKRYHQDPRFVALIIKQALSTQESLPMFRNMFNREIGTKLTMFYRAWSAQLELAGKMLQADLVLAEGERLGAEPADELAEARRKLQTRVASALAAGQLPAQTAQVAQIGRSAADERHALGALRGSADGMVPRQRVGAVQAGGPGTLPMAAPAAHQPRHNQRLKVFVDENAPQTAVPAPAPHGTTTELPTGRAMHKENVRKAGPWGAPQKASKRPTPPGGPAAPAFRVFEDSGAGAATGSPITIKQGALATRAAPAPAPAPAGGLDNIPVAHFEPPNDKVKVMYNKELIYTGASEVSFEELRAARWKKDNKLLLEQRRMHEEMNRQMQEMMRRNSELERQVLELRARPAPAPASSLHGSLGLSNVSGGSSSLGGGHSNLSGSTVLASPTVNTRDAMNYVREVMNRTVDTSVQLPMRHGTVPAAPPFTVYEEPESMVERPAAPAPAPFSIYEEPEAGAAPAAQKAPPAAAAAPFAVYEDDACARPAADGDDDDSDRENRPPVDCPPPPPRRRPPHVLVDAVDIPTEPLGAEEPDPAPGHGAPPARRPLQFDDELTGFVPLTDDVTIAAGDLSHFAAAAGRVASTPFAPPQPPSPVGGRARQTEEDSDFTANLRNVRIGRNAQERWASERVLPSEGVQQLTPIMERSHDQRSSSASGSSGSDMSRQSRGDVSAPMGGQQWRQRLPSGADRSQHQQSGRAPPPPQLTQSSGYLGDRSCSVRPASAVGGAVIDCSMSRRPDSADASGLQAPDVSMAAPAVSPNRSALRPAELSEKAAELSLAPAAELSHIQTPELAPAQPPAELSGFQAPEELGPTQPPAEFSALPVPAAELSEFQPPAELSGFQPPADLSEFQPPADLSDPQPPPAAELSALTLTETPAPAVPEHPDPWDSTLQEDLLKSLSRPVHTRRCYKKLAGKLPNFSRKEIEIDGQRLAVTLIGEGAYARVYHAIDRETGTAHCLKVQQDGGDWEFYVIDELHERLARDAAENPFLMSVDRMVAFDNGSVLRSDYQRAGTLLNAFNKVSAMYGKFDEGMVMLFTAEMLGAVSAVHSAGLIHGDIKPDNFLLRGGELEDVGHLLSQLSSAHQPQLLQLIDFGRAIDMTLLPPGTTFTRVVTTDDFTCPEMKEGREWTFQTDLFGVAASAHVLLFGSYLKLRRRPAPDGPWSVSGTIRRFWSPVWGEFFSTFLNIPSCSELPDLSAWRRRFLDLALSKQLDKALHSLMVAIKQP